MIPEALETKFANTRRLCRLGTLIDAYQLVVGFALAKLAAVPQKVDETPLGHPTVCSITPKTG